MISKPVISGASQIVAHVPDLVPLGSKPQREIAKDPQLDAAIRSSLRSFDEAKGYAPHQVLIGAMHPRELSPRPWFEKNLQDASCSGPDGEIFSQAFFLGAFAAVDEFGLTALSPTAAAAAVKTLEAHPFGKSFDLERVAASATDTEAVAAEAASSGGVMSGAEMQLVVRSAHPEDEALSGSVLLENLACKATATLALLQLIENHSIDPESIDYVITCAEEAVGDRYQRGGGNMAKAVAAAAGCVRASGCDLKDFCAAPIPALVMASSLVASGVFRRVVVVAGGSLPKLGMKFQGHLRNEMPVLEDVLGGIAALIEADDNGSPVVRLDSVGVHPVGAGGSNPQIMDHLINVPLDRLGLNMLDVDDYATELHNPELTEPQGSGNVPERNYQIMAAMAVKRKEIDRDSRQAFVSERGMPGFAPTQGHLASAFCYLPHAVRRLRSTEAERVLMVAKGSLFLGRMCELSDGMSVLLERNEGKG